MKKTEAKTLNDLEFVVALKAVSYCRVSTDDQADYGTSLDRQRKVNAEYADRNDIEIVATIEDDFSGRKLDRPGFTQVRTYLKDGLANCLIVFSADRLSRHRTHTLMIIDELQELGCDLHLSTKGRVNLDDNTAVLMLSIEGHMAHSEVDKITERMINGRNEKTSQGQIMAKLPPYGYQIEKEIEETPHGRLVITDRRLEVNPVESVIVKTMFEQYAAGGYSFNGLAKHLNRQSYTYRGGRQWNHMHVGRILQNRVYVGEYQYSGIQIEVPALIDREAFEAAQDVIAQNRKQLRRRNKYDYLFAQRVTCYHCKNAMSGSCRSHKDLKYYRCGSANKAINHLYKTLCPNTKFFREKNIQRVVFDWLEQVMTNPKTLRKGWEDFVAEQMKSHRPVLDELSRVEKVITTNERKLVKLLDGYLDEVIDKETYQQRKQFLDQAINEARLVKSNLEAKLADLDKLPQQLKTIEELELIAHEAFADGIPENYHARLIKELDVRVALELAANGGEQWAHITSIVGPALQVIGTSIYTNETISCTLYTRVRL